jgi:phytoene dehydrogenase-like protein
MDAQGRIAKSGKACVIGSGPNGLAAAIVLAQAGYKVNVFEAEETPGGAVRTMELTQPGFLHDFGSAVHPLAIGSPFFSSLPLEQYGLKWIHSPAPLAHPLDDGTAVVLERNLDDAAAALGADGARWKGLMRPFVEHWQDFATDVLHPLPSIPRHPWLMARFGVNAFASAKRIVSRFGTERARALFAGLAAHSFLRLDEILSGAFGTLMGISAHAVGWPIPGGGAQSITNALIAHLESMGGKLKTGSRVDSIAELSEYELVLCDVSPKELIRIAQAKLSKSYKRQLTRYRYGPGVFKVDYALSEPIPWKASECLRAATVHVGGSYQEIARSEAAARDGHLAERPFVLLAQPSLFDPSRAPAGKHTAWAYCHVPNGSDADILDKLESQIERFAPGFREIVLARRVFGASALEKMDSNLVGGDIGGGAVTLGQFLFRPTWRQYSTSASGLYICSASTPPGGGVHGMCGYHAAKAALKELH